VTALARQAIAFPAAETGRFTALATATPIQARVDAGLAMSNGPQSDWPSRAVIGRFNSGGTIDANKAGQYVATNSIGYTANVPVALRYEVSVPKRQFDLYAAVNGQPERAVAQNCGFRVSSPQLTHWRLLADSGALQGCNLVIAYHTALPGEGWTNLGFPRQTDAFDLSLNVVPGSNPQDAVLALGDGAQQYVSSFACLLRFATNGLCQVWDTGGYRHDIALRYIAGATHAVRFQGSVTAGRYMVAVTPPGGAPVVVASNCRFRVGVTGLSNAGIITDGSAGALRIGPVMLTAAEVDRFGVRKIYPTVGREWVSKFDTGGARTITWGRDWVDPWFYGRGEGSYYIDGAGVLHASDTGGGHVRMYIFDPAYEPPSAHSCPFNAAFDPSRYQLWHNVEVTVYGMRGSEYHWYDYAGLVIGAKIRHAPDEDLCGTRGYYGRVRLDGGIDVEKEVNHNCDAVQGASKSLETKPWPQFPPNQWVGAKFVCRDLANGQDVNCEVWRDVSLNADGSSWRRDFAVTDTGGWGTGLIPCASNEPADRVLTGPNLSIIVRNDGVTDFRYKWWSIREIAPL
jgi:hypothetical protein